MTHNISNKRKNKFDFIKMEKFFESKDIIFKKTAYRLGNIIYSHLSGKGLCPEYMKNS